MFQGLLQNSYGHDILVAQISIKLLLFAYVGTSIVAIIFSFFLWKRTRKLSSFYLLLISVCFGIWAFFSLSSWVGNSKSIMFSWSVLDIFLAALFVLSYWFLYAFIKKEDLPIWQKIVSMATLVPTLAMTVMNTQLDTFISSDEIAIESSVTDNYRIAFQLFFALVIIAFTFSQYKKEADYTKKKEIVLAGAGVFSFLIMFNIWMIISMMVKAFNLFGYGETSYYYNFEIYGLFGMPILLAFLGYLIMKYQAFDLKPIKSVMLVIVLMLILFVSVFV